MRSPAAQGAANCTRLKLAASEGFSTAAGCSQVHFAETGRYAHRTRTRLLTIGGVVLSGRCSRSTELARCVERCVHGGVNGFARGTVRHAAAVDATTQAAITAQANPKRLVYGGGRRPRLASSSCSRCTRPSPFAAQINNPIQTVTPTRLTTPPKRTTVVTLPSWPGRTHPGRLRTHRSEIRVSRAPRGRPRVEP